jgi:hypothetical protein
MGYSLNVGTNSGYRVVTGRGRYVMGKDNKDRRGHWWVDGVDMKEWVTVIITSVYAIVALIFATKAYNKKLTVIDNDFFWTLSWPVMVIVGFYFAEKIALGFGSAKLPRFTVKSSNGDGGDGNNDVQDRVDTNTEHEQGPRGEKGNRHS